MDLGALLIILAITAALVLPFFIINLKKRSKYRKFENDFINLARKEKITFSQKEIWNHRYAIGIDNISNKIIYANKQKEGVESTLIDLAEVEKCRIISINKTVKNQYGKNALTDRLELAFTFNNPQIPEKILEFYESADFMPNDDEHAHIDRWLRIINANLKNSKN